MLFVWGRNSAFRTKIATILCLLFFAGSTFFDGYGAAPLSRVIPISLLSILGMGIAGICLIYFYNGERGSRNAIFSNGSFTFLPSTSADSGSVAFDLLGMVTIFPRWIRIHDDVELPRNLRLPTSCRRVLASEP